MLPWHCAESAQGAVSELVAGDILTAMAHKNPPIKKDSIYSFTARVQGSGRRVAYEPRLKGSEIATAKRHARAEVDEGDRLEYVITLVR